MRMLIVLVALLSGACDKPTTPTREAIISKLGDHHAVVVADFGSFDVSWLKSLIPEPISCVRGLLDRKGLMVLGLSTGGSEAFLTKLPEAATRACVDKLALLVGGTTRDMKGAYEIEAGRDRYSIAWRNDIAAINEVGTEPSGKLSDKLLRQIARVPRGAVLFVATGASETYRIEQAILWIEESGEAMSLVAFADGTDPEAAKSYLGSKMSGFQRSAEERGFVIDDSWFTLTSPSPMTAKLEGKIPKSLFASAALVQ